MRIFEFSWLLWGSSLMNYGVVNAKHHKFEFVFTQRVIGPDNFGHESILINNQFPGPTLNLSMGDSVEVRTINRANRPLSIHWHGITQQNSPESDGVPNVSQLAIKRGQIYTYRFNVGNQVGTYWYHAHTGLDAEQMFGALIIHESEAVKRSLQRYNSVCKYDKEHTILLSEWWHKDPEEMVKGLTSLPWSFVGRPASILNNGQSYSEWGGAASSNLSLPFNKGFPVLSVNQGETYRIRIIGATGLSHLKFAIPNHKMILIESDGTYLEPVDIDYVTVNAGERYSVLVKFDQPIDNYLARSNVVGSPTSKFLNGYTIVHYAGAPPPEPLKRKVPLISPDDQEEFLGLTRYMEYNTITSNWYRTNKLPIHYYKVPMRVNREIVINSMGTRGKNGVPIMSINGRENKPKSGVTLNMVRNQEFTVNSIESGVYDIREGQDVQIVVQQWGQPGVTCAPHPWHLHGHSFHIVAQGTKAYQSKRDMPMINRGLENAEFLPRFRDTFTHYTNSINEYKGQRSFSLAKSDTFGVSLDQETLFDEGLNSGVPRERAIETKVPCGWYAIRFKADNPGSWFMHCHITAHMIMGKQLVINEFPRNSKRRA